MPYSIPDLVEMLSSGMHFGHRSSRWHPKMQPYIFAERNGVHVINLEKTAVMLVKALDYLRDTVAAGGTILLVGTKEQAQAITERVGKETGMPYVHLRWLGGTLTNFRMLKENLLSRYLDLKDKRDKGELGKYTKKEQLEFAKKIEEQDVKIGGFAKLTKLPEVVFIIDIKTEVTAYVEAIETNIPIVAICDTNVNPEKVAYVIPANDDAVKSIDLIMTLVAEAIKEGQKLYADRPIMPAPGAAPAKV